MRLVQFASALAISSLLLVGCGSSNHPVTDRQQSGASGVPDENALRPLAGSRDDWIASVCELRATPEFLPRGGGRVLMPQAEDGNIVRCTSRKDVSGQYAMILSGYYDSLDEARQDIFTDHGGYQLGQFAYGRDPSSGRIYVFVMRFEDTNQALPPLEKFGFVLGDASPTPSHPTTEQPRALPVPTQSERSATTPSTHSGAPDVAKNFRFRSESGNIACDLWEEGGQGEATCEIRQHDYQPPIMDGCRASWPNKFRLRQGDVVATYCYDGSIFNDVMPAQAYGRPISVGSITCVIEQSNGVTCKDSSTGHFFQASRQAYKWQ